MMYEKVVTITAKHGIHTRPAALLVKKAKSFDCNIIVECDGKKASAKSLFKLQTLGLYQGVSVKVIAEGERAEQAVEEVSELLITLS
ncbi:PTS sugar transporter [Shewanella sp. MBTL60-007]|nr:PTS sugar transporter [Shewanella sp. MBTL60-007]